MHVFERGLNESLVIGSHVRVTVVGMEATWVRLGIFDEQGFPGYREVTISLGDDDQYDDEQCDFGDDCDGVEAIDQLVGAGA